MVQTPDEMRMHISELERQIAEAQEHIGRIEGEEAALRQECEYLRAQRADARARLPTLLEIADTLDGKLALTLRWRDDAETVEVVSGRVAEALGAGWRS